MARRRLKKTVVRRTKLIVSMFFLILSCILYNTVYMMNIVPMKYLKLLLLGLLLINCVGMLLFMFRSKMCKFIGFLLYVILFFICVLGIKYSSVTLKFLNKAFKTKREFVIYDVIVLKDSEYNNILDLDNKKIGCLSIDQNNYMENITKLIKVEAQSSDLFTAYKSFMNKEVDGMVINHSYLTLLEEQYSGFNETFKTINTFDIEIVKEHKEERVKELKPITIYITGLDSRSGRIESTGLSDVNMLVTINPDTNTILLTGIPRDYYVQLHGTTGLRDKLTHSGTYGIDMSKATVEDLFDLKIDYSIKVGFNSVVDIVDMIGGIDIESDKGFWSYHIPNWYVEEGKNHMNGKQALAYARERFAYKEGDEHRVRNQQQVFTAIFNKMVKNKTILYKYDTILDELSDLYSTDIPKDYVTLLIKKQISNMKNWNIISQSVTGDYLSAECYSLPGTEVIVMEPNMESVKTAKKKIEEVLNK